MTVDPSVYTLAIGHDFGAYDYINAQGYVAGFTKDIIDAVCSAADITCETIWDKYPNCYNSEPGQHSFGGKGLMGSWYDGCTGWWKTVGRVEMFNFSLPYTKPTSTFLVVRANSSLQGDDVTGKIIGFLDGWASDEKCLARQDLAGVPLPVSSVVHVQTTDELAAKLIAGEVDAGFCGEGDLGSYVTSGQLKVLTAFPYECSLAGLGIMTRKDNVFAGEWNRGFEIIRTNGVFEKLCQDAVTKHPHGVIHCLDPQ